MIIIIIHVLIILVDFVGVLDLVTIYFHTLLIDKHQHMHFFIQHYISLEC